MKKENTKLLIFIGVLVAILIAALTYTIVDSNKSKKVVENVKNAINANGSTIVYFMSKDCSYCQLYENTIAEMEEYGVDFLKVDISKLSQSQINEITYYLQIGKLDQTNIDYLEGIINDSSLDKDTKEKFIEYANSNAITDDQKNEMLNAFKETLSESENETFESTVAEIGQYGTPGLTIVGDGEIKSQLSGYRATDELFGYLKQYGFIDNNEKLPLVFVDTDMLDEAVNSGENKLIVIAKSTCSYCLKFHTTLNTVARENKGLEILYVNMDKLFKSEDEYNNATSKYPWLKDVTGTPTTFIINNNEVVDSLEGYTEVSALTTFLKTNGMVK